MTSELELKLEDLRVRLQAIEHQSCTPQIRVMVQLAIENLAEIVQSLKG